MLLAIDVPRGGVLFLVELFLLAGVRLAAVGPAVCADLLVGAPLLLFKRGRLAGGQLSAFDALRDVVLLILFSFRCAMVDLLILERKC